MSKVCAFFGHREIPAGLEKPLEEQIRKAIIEDSITSFWVGGYGQFDSLASHAVHKLKQEFPEIELLLILAYLPTEGQKIPSIYDGSIYPEGLELIPKRFALSKRNAWMAKNCDMAICYVKNSFGGANESVRYAQGLGVPIINLADQTFLPRNKNLPIR